MNPYIKNPKVLLLKCSIEYLYREETKLSCIDPIVLQVKAIPLTPKPNDLQFLKIIYNLLVGARVSEELRPEDCRPAAQPGAGGEDRVPNGSGHVTGARNYARD